MAVPILFLLLAVGAFTQALGESGRCTTTVGSRGVSNQSVRVRFVPTDECLRVVAAGVTTRNAPPAPPTTGGTITLPEGPTTENIVWAGLYWEILGDYYPPHTPTINGHDVSPVLLPVTITPCYPEIAHAYAFFAEVTTSVVPGENEIDGLDDSGESPDFDFNSEGASLVVIYRSESSSACEIVVFDGNDVTGELTVGGTTPSTQPGGIAVMA